MPARSPVVTVTGMMRGVALSIVYIHGVVHADAGAAVMLAKVGMAVIRVSPITLVIYAQVIARPGNVKCRGHTPKVVGRKCVPACIRIVINRARLIVIVINRLRLPNYNPFRLVVRHINYVIVDGINLDDVGIAGYSLVFIRL